MTMKTWLVSDGAAEKRRPDALAKAAIANSAVELFRPRPRKLRVKFALIEWPVRIVISESAPPDQ